jgi:hypothetical protein
MAENEKESEEGKMDLCDIDNGRMAASRPSRFFSGYARTYSLY